MPVAPFPGSRNWGYDVVFPFAIQNSYGSVEALHQLVDACHAKGIAVILDAIYNHIGPEGNYLPRFGPYYQTLMGTTPTGMEHEGPLINEYNQRIKDYLQKALREAKTHSTWAEPNIEYENASIAFAQALINGKNEFHQSFIPFLQRITDFGIVNSMSQLVLKFTCPGIPDTYQGTELWYLSLVDSDYRRPVDFNLRKKITGRKSTFL